MTYNDKYRHRRDELINFEPESHTYTFAGEVFDSVTTVIEGFFEPFDADYWAERKAAREHRSAEEIKREWEQKGAEARDRGTQMHDRIERYYLGEEVPADWMQDVAFRHFAAFTHYFRLNPCRSEWRIFHEESRLAGTLDFLAFNPDGTLDIWDWKRSSKIVTQNGFPIIENQYGHHAFEPIAHIPDTSYQHYALQLSVYRYILETKYHLRIRGMHLGIFHPDYNRFHTVDLQYLRPEVEAIIASRL